MDKKKLLNTGKLLLKTAVTVGLVYLVFQKIDLSQVISSYRLLGFVRLMGIPAGFGFNFRLYLLGMFYNVFLPGGIGGDGYKVYLLRKKFRQPTKVILFGLLIDRATGLWAIAVLASVCILGIPQIGLAPAWVLGGIAVFVAGLYLLYRFFFRRFLPWLPAAMLIALVVQALQMGAVLLILRALHAEGSYLPYLFSFMLSTIATIVPLSVGGLGLREYAILQLAPLLLLDQATAVSTSLCFYVISTIAALPGIWFVYRSKEFAPASEMSEEAVELPDKNG
jgi:glycosyltransferase 2 family protein